MWNDFIETLRAQLANQVVAGAVALGLVGLGGLVFTLGLEPALIKSAVLTFA